MDEDRDVRLTQRVIGLAIEVHRRLGPGLLESAYQTCLCHELTLAGVQFVRQKALPVHYKGAQLDCQYQMDIVVDDYLVLEIKSVATIHPVHEAQPLTDLRLSGYRLGLLLNFNCVMLKDGIRRRRL